ncbi:lipocalin family protein [Streptomyces sp. NPDC051561]|uniref:lipocalin family protein n=1 Tax=Streptomyces sp. NPDC051561 TaxID=3365658 RepID=UPI0037B1318C
MKFVRSAARTAVALAAATACVLTAGGAAPAAPASSAEAHAAPVPAGEPASVGVLDVPRYLGHWFQFAAVPRAFEAKCAKNVHGVYGLRPSGSLSVRNGCTTWQGRATSIEGEAKPLDATGSRLNVSFVAVDGVHQHGENANYIVVGLAPDHRWAVVTDSARRSGFVLSRTPGLSPARQQAARHAIRAAGLDPCSFLTTRQDGGSGTSAPFC